MAEKLNILMVDDEEVICELFTRTLGLKGYKVTTAKDGPSAIEAVKKNPYDLIFMDVVMAGMDGVEVVRKIRGLGKSVVIAMMTGFSVEEKLKEAKQLGTDGVLHKPFDIVEIMGVVERVEKEKK